MRELERLAREVRAELGEPSPNWLRWQQRALTSALGVQPTKRAVGGWAFTGALVAVLVVAVVWSLASARGSTAPVNLALTASTDGRRVPLADGSSLLLSAHTQARLTGTERGTNCLIEVGKVQFDVVPQQGREFKVRAGSFEVTVVGTRFSVSRDRAGVVEVLVSHGVVRVQVPGRSSPTELRAGDQLRGDGTEVSLRHDAPPVATTRGQEAPPNASAQSAQSSAAAIDAQPPLEAPSKAATTPRDAWLRLYRGRNYTAALAAAREVGVDSLLESLAAQPLAELGEAARLGGDGDLALRAFDALGRRFPGSRQAQDALFLSGRLLASRGQLSVARRQFEAYLARNDRGTYSVEALGRLVEIYATSKDPRAASTARAYLERAPQGPYRRLCLSVLAAP